ncbi:MAG: ABC transporter ATP-binding protein [Gammaproteobacteria bacterium]|nr:ABC transporter ATP-binding protein [Gammaproteobacteria bacterium]
MTPLLSVTDLSIKIADTTLLSSVNFHVNQGDYICVLGANGAGKSTLLKALLGIIKPTMGDITINQQAVSQLSQKQRAQQISYVPQAHNQQFDLTVIDFIKMSRYAYHTALSDWANDDQSAFEQAIDITHTEAFLHRHIQTLSGGERQRIMIAAALCQQASLILLDEPTSFLDPHYQAEVHQLIRQLNQQHGISVIEVSHDLNHAVQHSSSILALKHGKKIWFGASPDFLDSNCVHSLYNQQFIFTHHPQTGAKIALVSEEL